MTKQETTIGENIRTALAEASAMTNSEQNAIMQRAIDTYGVQAQCDVAIEEMAELTKAIMKIRRVNDYAAQADALNNIIEEIADVDIMIDQLKIIYGEHCVNEVREEKLKRLEDRLDEAGN